MTRVIRTMMLIMLGLSLVGCGNKMATNNPSAQATPGSVEGGVYFTQVVMHYEKNVYPTTNYMVGATIPVNTMVKVLDMNKKTISIEVTGTNQKITVKNMPKHTGDDINQIFSKLFANRKVDLTQFNALEKKNIDAGTVAVGMRKKAVTVAIGYPPITRTMNLDANSWVYWKNRYNTFSVNFKDGKVSDIVD